MCYVLLVVRDLFRGGVLDRPMITSYLLPNLMSTTERVHATVSGMVQGVGYRFFVVRAASQREITGWVRNTLNGKVEVVAEGESGMLHELMSKMQQGPPGAQVTGVAVEPQEYLGEFQTFEVRF